MCGPKDASAQATVPKAGLRAFSPVLAVTPWMRLRGLLGRPRSWLGENGVLAIVPCDDIHTFGMRESIDVAFLDERGIVLHAAEGLAPGKRLRCPKARMVLERFTPNSPVEFRRPWFAPGERVRIF